MPAVQQPQQVLPIFVFGHGAGEFCEPAGIQPTLPPGDFFEAGDLQVLQVLHGLHKGGGFVQALVGAGVEPGEAAAEQLHGKAAVFEAKSITRLS